MANLSSVVGQLRSERARIAKELERLDAALAALNGASGKKRPGVLSPAARERIAAAQRARWAKVRANRGQQPNVVRMPKRRPLSLAARRKIAAAQRARWAKVRALKKPA
jgi:hypothetical protein